MKLVKNTNAWVKATGGKQATETIQEVGSHEEAYDVVSRLEDRDFFEQQDNTVVDQQGNEVYNPKYPHQFDFGEYTYIVID